MKEFNSNIENINSHIKGKEESEELNDMENFNFLTEEELSELDEIQLSDYYIDIEKKIALDEIKNNKKMNEIGNQELLRQQKELLDNLYKNDTEEPYWNK